MNSPVPPLEIEQHPQACIARFRKLSRLDQTTLDQSRAQLEQALTDPGPPRIIIDLAQFASVSSAFLGWLVMTASRLEARGLGLTLSGLGPAVKQVFDITKLSSRFTITSDVAAALSVGPGHAGEA